MSSQLCGAGSLSLPLRGCSPSVGPEHPAWGCLRRVGVSWPSLPSRLLIAFVSDEEAFAWQGYLYSILLFLTALIQSLCLQQYFHLCFHLGTNVRASLIAAIYKKVGMAPSPPSQLSPSWAGESGICCLPKHLGVNCFDGYQGPRRGFSSEQCNT